MKKSALLFIFTFIISALCAEIVVLTPSDDMYTDAEHAGTAPAATELWAANYSTAGHFERIMINFDLSPYQGRILLGATLHLTRFFSCPSSGTTAANIYAISQEWDESTWDYTQHVQYDDQTTMPCLFTGQGGSVVSDFELDMTDFYNNMFIGTIENHGFVVLAQDNQKFSKFYSKEFANEAFHPTLTLELVDTASQIDDLQTAISAKNYPNPFNPVTHIAYNLPLASHVTVEIYNSKGQKVNTLLSTNQDPGEHTLIWTGCDDSDNPVASGIYHYFIRTESQSSFGSMHLLK